MTVQELIDELMKIEDKSKNTMLKMNYIDARWSQCSFVRRVEQSERLVYLSDIREEDL
jgi:hypothetical protein